MAFFLCSVRQLLFVQICILKLGELFVMTKRCRALQAESMRHPVVLTANLQD
jgi:hypothetical protein